MSYNEETADRFREKLGLMDGVGEKKMMGGICFLHHGNMIGGVSIEKKTGIDKFMFRVGKDNEAEAIAQYGAEALSFTGRKMGGLVERVCEECNDDDLKGLFSLSMSFVSQLPSKKPKEKK